MVDVVFALGSTQELALVGVDAQAIVVGERGGQRGDVLVADVELAAGDMGQLGRSLHGVGCIVAAEGGVEYPAVVDDVGHASRLAVGGVVGVEGILGLQVLDNADLALKAALMEGDDGLGVGHHHVVHELEGLVQAILLAVRPVADDKAALGGRGNLVKGKPVLDLGELGKAELGVLDKGVDRRARQESLAVVLVKGLGRIKVIERDIGDNASFVAGGEKLVIESDALGVNLAGAVGEDTAPSDGDTDAVDAETLAQVDIDRVLVVEIACGIGGEATLSRQEIVPGHFALAVRTGLALNLVSSGGAAKHKAVGELHGVGHESSFLWDTNRERCPNRESGHQQREELVEVLAEPLDGASGVASKVDIFLTAGSEQLNAQAIGVGLHVVVVATNLRGEHDNVVLIHDGSVLAIGACGGSDVLSGLRSTFLDGVGEHGRGAGAGAQDEDLQAIDILLSGCVGGGLGLIGDRLAVGGSGGRLDGSGGLLDSGRRGAGGDGGSTIGLETQLGGALGLLVAEQLIVCLQERQVDDGVQQDDDRDKYQGDKLEVRGDEDADGGRGSPRHHEGEAVHAHVVDKELGNTYVDAAGGNKGDEHVGVKDHRRAKEQRFVDGEGNRNNRGLTDGFELLGLHKENQQKRHDERGAGAAELTHERHVKGEGVGGVATGQQNLQVLLAWLARRMGSMPGWTIEGPWTPMNQKNAVAAWIRIRPG